jgi:hypothetical protein
VSLPAVRKIRVAPAVEQREPAPALTPPDSKAVEPGIPPRQPLSVEQELEQWKEARKVRKRSFREPWRSVSIVAGLGFLATSWILPDSVAYVGQVALGVLTAGSFIAGWRVRRAS